MARAKARAGGRAGGTTRGGGRTRRGRRRLDTPEDAVPDVFKDMLSEAGPSDDLDAGEEARPSKKRKVEKAPAELHTASSSPKSQHAITNDHEDLEHEPKLQTITDESDDSDDSDDMDWEEVALEHSADYLLKAPEKNQQPETLEIGVGKGSTEQKPARVRRKAATTAERVMRLNVHKMHLLCLLYHSHVRNAWCNDSRVQVSLKRFLSTKIKTCFTSDPTSSQLQASKLFTDGLSLAKDVWKKFKITSLGIRRAKWANDVKKLEAFRLSEDADPLMDLSDFRKAAVAFEGSPDTGAQLFCAFLRAAGVGARLVCSLQPLPFATSAQPPASSTPKSQKTIVYADGDLSDELKHPSSPKPTLLKKITRIGRPGFGTPSIAHQGIPSSASMRQRKTIPHPRYPVYWVEAFNSAHQKWVAVDPIATGTVGKPSRLESPLSDPDVNTTYAVAFEDDGVAKDVTRRYVKAYNAKTRKSRVESTENGERWWRKTTKIFRRRSVLNRDQVEDAELAKREASEEMPKNVQDFKHHPYYVLERHLKHNEVIHPKREVGKVNVGTAANSNLQPIYRRRDVHQLKSADKWYRLGREIKSGEQPLKHAKPRQTKWQDLDPETTNPDLNAEEPLGAGLYADFQTDLYIPPSVVRGRVPRNAFGNLDIYVPSMVPPGGAHIRAQNARHAARVLGIDYADAVTGFQFKGRHGTAVVEGIVVAAEYRNALEAVLDGMQNAEEEEEQCRKSMEALRLWRRFLTGLRIVQRVQAYASADERKEMELGRRMDRDEQEEEEEGENAGGFFPAAGADEVAEPTARKFGGDAVESDDGEGGGFLPEEHAGDLFQSRIMDHAPIRPRASRDFDRIVEDEPMDGGGFLPDAQADSIPHEDSSFILEDGGGFVPEDGGGFMPEEGGGFMPEGGGAFIPEEGDDSSPNADEAGGDLKEDKPGQLIPERLPMERKENVEPAVGGSSKANTSTLSSCNADAEEASSSIRINEALGVVEESTGSVIPPANSAAPSAALPRQEEGGCSQDAVVNNPPLDAQASPNLESGGKYIVASSDDEKGSLPSHDPEDEDAEPEWLVSD